LEKKDETSEVDIGVDVVKPSTDDLGEEVIVMSCICNYSLENEHAL
jgi:hypothetical protein